MSGKWKRRAVSDIILIVSGVIVVLIIPVFTSVPAGCLFNKLTGLYCAGCGTSRGVHALLRFDISKAIQYNLLLVTVFPLSGIWLIIRYSKLKYSENLKKYDIAVIIVFTVIVLIFMILRNIPHQLFNFLRPI